MLQKIGFTINLYERCVLNKVINGKQFTLTWYIDDNKLPYVETTVVDKILKILNNHLGYLTIQRGKKFALL